MCVPNFDRHPLRYTFNPAGRCKSVGEWSKQVGNMLTYSGCFLAKTALGCVTPKKSNISGVRMIKDVKAIVDADTMIFTARSLHELTCSFDNGADISANPYLFSGKLVAGPVLLTLAMELALKAWWIVENEERKPLRTHDLVKLFDGLPERARTRLEIAYPEIPNTHPELQPIRLGLRSLLDTTKSKFVEWRYPHEMQHAEFPNGEFGEALSTVIKEFALSVRQS